MRGRGSSHHGATRVHGAGVLRGQRAIRRLYGARVEAGVGAAVESRVESDDGPVLGALVDPPIVKTQ